MEYLFIPFVIFVIVGMVVIYKRTMDKREFFEEYYDIAKKQVDKYLKSFEIKFVGDLPKTIEDYEVRLDYIEHQLTMLGQRNNRMEHTTEYNIKQYIKELEKRIDKLEYDVDCKTKLNDLGGNITFEVVKSNNNSLSDKEIEMVVDKFREDLKNKFTEEK